MEKQSTTHPPCAPHVQCRIVFFCLLYLYLPLFLTAQSSTATSTPLILPSAIVFDATGSLYFAETGHHDIRKVDTDGNISTIAGTGEQGFSGDSGPATSAALDSPQGIALDTSNNLYIADTHNHRIRRVNLTSGIIVTIAGSTPGFAGDNGSAAAAQLNLPTAITSDAAGNLYFADTANHRIRTISAASDVITTLAGNGIQGYSGDGGLAISAAIDSPAGIALDGAGNLYLADTHNNRIRSVAANTGIITTVAGSGQPRYSGDNSSATAANLALPHGLTIDSSGNLYLADTANHRIRRIDATTGFITTVAGDGTQTFAGDNGSAITASLDSPNSTALSPAGLLTLSDLGNQRIRQLNAQPSSASTINTIAGLSLKAPVTLSLSAPSVITYGTGQLTASLVSSPATGNVTFIDTIGTGTTAIGTTAIVSNTATLSTATLSAGPHSLIATYSGDQSHLPVQSPVLNVTIDPTSTRSLLSIDASNGSTAILTLRVASSTTGTPSGTATFLDGSSPLFTTPLSAFGDAIFTTSVLAQGNHTFSAVYSGSADFTSSNATPQLIAVGTSAPVTPDFALSATGAATQTILSGASATYAFAVQMQGNLSSPITLAATGLPNLATAFFNPAILPPGAIPGSFTLTIATPKTTALEHLFHRDNNLVAACTILFLPIAFVLRTFKHRTRLLSATTLSLILIFTTGCGSRINTASLSSTPATTYTITVTGTATSSTGTPLQHTASVTLVLQPAT